MHACMQLVSARVSSTAAAQTLAALQSTAWATWSTCTARARCGRGRSCASWTRAWGWWRCNWAWLMMLRACLPAARRGSSWSSCTLQAATGRPRWTSLPSRTGAAVTRVHAGCVGLGHARLAWTTRIINCCASCLQDPAALGAPRVRPPPGGCGRPQGGHAAVRGQRHCRRGGALCAPIALGKHS